jgi:hypothetical protein
MGRVRIGNAHHQVAAQGLSGQQIRQMIVVKNLEPTVDDPLVKSIFEC